MSAPTTAPAPDVVPLLRVLTQQSALFDRLLLAARSLELLVAAGEAQFLASAADEASSLVAELSALELARAVTTDALAASLGLLGSDHTLAEIAAALDGGHAAALQALGATLQAQAAEYALIAGDSVTELVSARLDTLDTTMERLTSGGVFSEGYGDGGAAPASVPVPALRFDGGA